MAPLKPASDTWQRFERLLLQQRQALIAGDLAALALASADLRAWLNDPAWRTALSQATPAQRALAQAQLTINAQCSARAQASAHRTLASIGRSPSVYTVAGGLKSSHRSSRRTAA